MRQALIRSGLEMLYFSGAHRALKGLLGGVGAIVTLHHVRPARNDPFQPNRLLEVTPQFLDEVIVRLRAADVDLVSLDEMHERLTTKRPGRRFVCITLDDGYRDNREFAYPILKRHAVPFAIYVPASFADGEGELWWIVLERIVARATSLRVAIDGIDQHFTTDTAEQKRDAFAALYWWLRRFATEEQMRAAVRALAQQHGCDIPAICGDLCMRWDEIAALAADPLVTIGAHTVNHVMLRKVPDADASAEISGSADAIAQRLGVRPAHFSYPVGDATSAGPREFAMARELGFKTAVTTRPGVLFAQHRDHLTALPRISLNGEFQRLRYLDVLTSGAATAFFNGFRRVDAA